ncbi:alpha/beta hydrolase [Metabacillus sp. RGM 3146]|uniref:alpha/beta hydrolase n=1 Tax=Metabacillus sp. RGM 3146 TaxID=3401092 RepID=UPI003B9D4EEF
MAFTAIDDKISTFLTQPLLLVAGSKAGTRWQSEEVYQLANELKELVILDGATHFDMYDIPQYVDQAVPKMVAFFDEYLRSEEDHSEDGSEEQIPKTIQ